MTAEERERRLAQKPAIIACNGRKADNLAVAVERALFDQGKTTVVLTENNAGTADDRRRTAQLLAAHGLIAVAVNLGTDVASVSISADSEEAIPGAVNELIQGLVRDKRV